MPAPDEGIASVEDVAAESAVRLDLARALAALGPRDLVALLYGADLSARQMAEVLEMKTNAVEVALHRILLRLHATLEEPEGTPSVPLPGSAVRADVS